ncbi:MAG: N-acetyltransferase, partial [Burkholderiales bacterium]|nr:N-acetyltransferase [Burkholderiales bacterium]
MNLNIHPTSYIAPGAVIGNDVVIGPLSIIHKNVSIGDGTIVGSYCELGVETTLGNGTRLEIGKQSTIRSHSVFYESSQFGDRLVTGHRVTVRENTVAGENLQIGTLGDIQGDCTIGDFVRFHSNVHIGKKSTIGNFVWVFPYVVLTNDPTPPSETLLGVTLDDFSIIATMAVILPGVRIGQHALVAASACVGKDVP